MIRLWYLLSLVFIPNPRIFVKWDGGLGTIDVKYNDTISHVADKIFSNLPHLPSRDFYLAFMGVRLNESKTISDYWIGHLDELEVVSQMQVSVRNASGQNTVWTVWPTDTVGRLKWKIHVSKSGAPGRFCLVSNATTMPSDSTHARTTINILADNRTLANCSIQNGSVLYTVLRADCA